MSITNQEIRQSTMSPVARELLVKVNDATATAAEINSSNLSLAEKAVLLDLLAATGTRAGINGALVDPPIKDAGLAQAGV